MCLGVPADRAGRAHGHPAFCTVGSQRTPVPEGGLRESLSRAARPQLPLCLAPTLGRQRYSRVTRRFSCSCTLSSVSFAVRSFYLWCHLAGRFLLLSLVFRCHTQRLVTKTSAGSFGSSAFQPPDGLRSYGEAFNPRRCAVRVWCERRVRFHSPARGRFPSMYWRDSPFPTVVSLDWGKRTPSRRQSLVRVKQTCAHNDGGVSKWHRSCRGERTLGDPNWGDPNSKIIKYHWIITQSEK